MGEGKEKGSCNLPYLEAGNRSDDVLSRTNGGTVAVARVWDPLLTLTLKEKDLCQP